jgi:hypothetical protein
VILIAPTTQRTHDPEVLAARIALLEEENRWLKAQLFGRSSEKTAREQINPDQARLFNEIEALAESATLEPEKVTVPAYERTKRGRKKLSAALPRVEIIHDLSEADKLCPVDGTALERIGEETCEQLEIVPARIRVLRHIRYMDASPMARSSRRDDRQIRLQVYIRPVCADRSLRALMDFADPYLISLESSKLGWIFRFGGSRSDLLTITRCSPCATF